jgi:choline kinase
MQREHMEKLIQNTSNHTVLILAAGFGRRMGPFSRMVNKCLVPYDNKPLVSHIIEKFPTGTQFVIACGNMGQQVKDYVGTVHSEKNITFVDIPEFSEGNTGPATTIQYCSSVLPEKFFWITCDTLFDFDYSNKLNHNWIAVHPVDSSVAHEYSWVIRDGDTVLNVFNKEKSNKAVDAFIGLMYVADKRFLNNLSKAGAKDVYEGFNGIELKAHTVSSWQDFGTYDKWKEHSEGLPEVSFPKPDELFYADNGKIIKFTTSASLAESKFRRAELNRSCMPSNVSFKGNFLFYDRAAGDTLYNCLSRESFVEFLDWAEENLWKEFSSDNTYTTADTFYKKKTFERLSKFRVKYSSWTECAVVNGKEVKTIDEYINGIDFDWLASETKWCYIHGDLQFDNIIYNNSAFTCIDWRTDFGGDMYGDIYYDLAKMLGGLLLSYKLVKEDEFYYQENENEAHIGIPSVENYQWYRDTLRNWVIDKGLNWQKVRILVPIIYLNMSPLHEAPFDKFLIALAQYAFAEYELL